MHYFQGPDESMDPQAFPTSGSTFTMPTSGTARLNLRGTVQERSRGQLEMDGGELALGGTDSLLSSVLISMENVASFCCML
jgi:hypothetical protein